MKKRWIVSLSFIIAALTCSCESSAKSSQCKNGKCPCKCENKCGCPTGCPTCQCKS